MRSESQNFGVLLLMNRLEQIQIHNCQESEGDKKFNFLLFLFIYTFRFC